MNRALEIARIATMALSVSLAASCVSGAWRRQIRFTPPRAEVVAALEFGEATLAECLERLGAPLYVWEYKGDGVALAYGAYRDRGFGVSLSIPVAQDFSASFDYDDARAKLEGVVLLFGADLKLEQVRAGFLRELHPRFERKRPSPALDEP